MRLIAALRAKGQSYSAIAAQLNERGYASLRGGRWFGASVRQTLINATSVAKKIKRVQPAVVSPDQALFDAWHANLISAGAITCTENKQHI
ncbi:MAG: recombinase family protein [Pseudomonadota bacterium]